MSYEGVFVFPFVCILSLNTVAYRHGKAEENLKRFGYCILVRTQHFVVAILVASLTHQSLNPCRASRDHVESFVYKHVVIHVFSRKTW